MEKWSKPFLITVLAIIIGTVTIGVRSMQTGHRYSSDELVDEAGNPIYKLPTVIDTVTINVSQIIKQTEPTPDEPKPTPDNNVNPTPTTPTAPPSDKLSYIWSELRKTMTPEAAAGAMGNLQAEHGFQTDDVAGGLGMVQWTGDRKTLAYKVATAMKQTATSFEFQTAYMLMEVYGDPANGVSKQYSNSKKNVDKYINSITTLSTSAGRTLPSGYDNLYQTSDAYKAANDVDKAAMSWMCFYERPTTGVKNHADNRANYAQTFYKTYNK